MSTFKQKISRAIQQKGYQEVIVERLRGTWRVSALDPLNKCTLEFENLGSSGDAAIENVAKIQAVPTHYVCGYSFTCDKCKAYARPLGYTELSSGNLMLRCLKCRHERVALTAMAQDDDAKRRMQEALEILDPEIRRFVRGRSA